MDPLAIGKALGDLGGWAAFLALIATIGLGGIRRWWVFGWMYDRLETRAEKAETIAERNAESLESSSKAFEVMGRSYDRLERDVERIASDRVKRD